MKPAAFLLAIQVVLSLALTGCRLAPLTSTVPAAVAPTGSEAPTAAIEGRVEAPAGFSIAATTAQVLASASVTLADLYGNAIVTGTSNGAGTFRLAPSGFVPTDNALYVLEASKALGATGARRGAGDAVVRFRTLLKWTAGNWLSISNATTAQAIVLNPLTTAVALQSALDPVNIAPANTIGKVNAVPATALLNAAPAYTGHPDSEFTNLAADLVAYLAADQDPTAGVSSLKPQVTSLSVGGGSPGDFVTIYGTGFIPLAGRNSVSIGTGTASVYVATARTLIVQVPTTATTGNVVVQTSYGTSATSAATAFTAGRVSVTVDPAGYLGLWAIPGVTGDWQRDKTVLQMSPNRTYTLQINGMDPITFSLNAAGTVTVTGGTATGSGNVLTFSTVSVTIKHGTSPKLCMNSWNVANVTPWRTGTQTIKLLPKNDYSLVINGAAQGIPFELDAANNVTVLQGSQAATGGAGTLTMNVEQVTINPNNLESTWIVGGGIQWVRGIGTVYLVKDLDYSLSVSGIDSLQFKLKSDATVSTTDSRATVSGATLSLAYQDVTINTNGFDTKGDWSRSYTLLGRRREGDIVIRLLKNARYGIRITGAAQDFFFDVDSTGAVKCDDPAASASGSTLTFNTANVTIVRNGYEGNWFISGVGSMRYPVPSGAGNPTVKLVVGLSYELNPENIGRSDPIPFYVAANGVVTSYSSVCATGGANTLTLNTQAVTVNPNGWCSRWAISGVDDGLGQKSVTLLKGRDYILFPNQSWSWSVSFSVSSTGAVDSGVSHTGGAGTLTLKTARYRVNPNNDLKRRWYVQYAEDDERHYHYGDTGTTSSDGLALVWGLDYQVFEVNASDSTDVGSPGRFTLSGTDGTISTGGAFAASNTTAATSSAGVGWSYTVTKF